MSPGEVETTEVWRWHTVEPRRDGVLVDTAAWWDGEVARRAAEGWRLVEQRPSGYQGCTVYLFTREVAG
jgi:hypothetical protein